MADISAIEVARIVANELSTRPELERLVYGNLPGYDIDKACRYPTTVTEEQYGKLYDREGVAARVVNVLPDECWQVKPEVYETEDEEETAWETAWNDLENEHHVLSLLQRVDRLSGVGRYGVVLFGVADGKSLDQPVEGVLPDGKPAGSVPARKLLFLRVFDERTARIIDVEKDERSPRLGLPTKYRLMLADGPEAAHTVTKEVHWTRVEHVADNCETSEMYGVPRQQRQFNRLLDLRKILGGSPEGIWRSGFPFLALETVQPKEGGTVKVDADGIREQVRLMFEGLQRELLLQNMTSKSISGEVTDPTSHFMMQIQALCITIGCPLRVFMGTEEAKLAGSQDARAWNKRLLGRQTEYLTPFLIRAMIDRLMALGVLPYVDTYCVDWPDIEAPSDAEKAETAKVWAEALSKYVAGGCDQIFPPMQFLTLLCKLSPKEALAVVEAAEEYVADMNDAEDARLLEQQDAGLIPDPTQQPPPGAAGVAGVAGVAPV